MELIHKDELIAIQSLEEGFFERYVGYARQLTDAPLVYHQACALSILSAVIGPRATEPLLGLRPNLWTILLGPSTIFRKTTSLAIAAKLLMEVDESVFLPTDFSPQSLVTEFSQRSDRSSLLLRDEVSGFFHMLKRADYMAGVKELLIKLFDGDSFRRRLQREEFVVRAPYFVWLSGAVTEKFLDSVTDDDVFSGLLIRFMLILPDHKESHKLLEYEHLALDGEREDLVFELKQIRDLLEAPWQVALDSYFAIGSSPKHFVMNSMSLERFNQFVEDLEDEGLKDPILEKLNSRIGPLALKLMMLFALNHHRLIKPRLNIVEVDHRVVLKSLMWASFFQSHLKRVLTGIGRTKRERLFQDIVEIIERAPGVSRSTVMRKKKLSAREMDDIEQTLVQRDLIQLATKPDSRGRFYFVKGG